MEMIVPFMGHKIDPPPCMVLIEILSFFTHSSKLIVKTVDCEGFFNIFNPPQYKEKWWDAKQFIASGGMPSSNSATVTALAAGVGIIEGFGSSNFSIALILASIVMYDAFGIRLHAEKQAEVLNQIVYELPEEHPLFDSKPLRELLGHTVPRVIAGGFLG
ncbi:Acid phosphatase/vanadium-dependent haloperoxidase-related protein [Rhynchospora pubera]|uniref:Acid phosphatase/vanadium-dependent haloperoxidase-related protein n=1 Tax=Rhynchospora pubera TaxID=906938 RepID=A0AAV8E3R3_9POAL|nr:Acid phosphatase/vanadium-dependent haloperoxidase-related protein [Rhynchospora pubera]